MINRKWEFLQVGMRRAEWLGLPDGMVMDWTDECGLSLVVYWNNPSDGELTAARAQSRFEIAFRDIDGVGFFGVKFGDMPWGDCVFSPNLYDSKLDFSEIEKGKSYALHIMVIDTAKGELKVLRSLALGREFAEKFRLWCLKSLERNIGKFSYNRIVDKVFKDYPTTEMLVANADFRWILSHGANEKALRVEEHE